MVSSSPTYQVSVAINCVLGFMPLTVIFLGLHDTNLARVRATQNYLLRCNNIFIVAKISRAVTDQSLKSSLFSALSLHIPLEWEESGGKSLNIAVVCTRSEVSLYLRIYTG
jgi:hypothetical protein